MDPIKEAFQKIKQDIQILQQQLSSIQLQLKQLQAPTKQTQGPTQPVTSSDNSDTYSNTQTHTPTLPKEIGGLENQNMPASTGNQGVPTDKPTDRQTNQQTDRQCGEGSYNQENTLVQHTQGSFAEFERVKTILDSLDDAKKSIRLKFKRLTPQEMLIFSALYTLENQNFDEITYKLLANNLNLSESSIRDYINKLIQKGIPINKHRQNNKKIALSISKNLKQLTDLSTINKLREL